MLHRLLGQEASAGRTVRPGCRHYSALCAAVGSVSGAPWVATQVLQADSHWWHEVGPKGLLPP